jgi:aminoglycoside 3-N-acetyltransferase
VTAMPVPDEDARCREQRSGDAAGVPATRSSLVQELRRLGVPHDATLLVHTSLSALGWVVGGEQTVLHALRDVVGARGTLVMPAQSWQLCDPAYLNNPCIPRAWWPLIRRSLPAYDPHGTPTRTMGAVAELFRTQPDTLRSDHPHRSFAASGPRAAEIVARHALDSPVGEESPLRGLYNLDARVLLLGAGHDKMTALHLAEHRCEYPGKHHVRNGAPLTIDGERRWHQWEELWVADDDFDAVAGAFAASTGLQRSSPVGEAEAHLLPMRPLVDFAARWFPQHRTARDYAGDTTGW